MSQRPAWRKPSDGIHARSREHIISNSFTPFFEALTAAADNVSKALVGPNYLLDVVYRDLQPDAMRPYSTLQIPIPGSTNDVSDVGNGGLTFGSVTANSVNLSFGSHPATGFVVADFDDAKMANPKYVQDMFLDERVKFLLTHINQDIAALITNVNFSQAVTGTTAGTVPRSDVLKGLNTLMKAKVNVRDAQSMFLVVAPDCYTNMLDDSAWVAYNEIGGLATSERLSGRFAPQFGVNMDYDLDIPANGGGFTNILLHKYAIGLGLRPLPNVTQPGAESRTIMVRGIPMRVTVSYQHASLGYAISLDVGYALGVVRANHAVRIISA